MYVLSGVALKAGRNAARAKISVDEHRVIVCQNAVRATSKTNTAKPALSKLGQKAVFGRQVK
jgi:hypothetical protein